MLEKIILAKPRGFCAGVERAVEIVERVLARHGAPVYVKHEIVHNRHVVEDFRRRGVAVIEHPREAPEGAVLVYSAHGVSPHIRRAAAARKQRIYDATCPLVTKVHSEIIRLRAAGTEVIMIGHRGHPEVEGALGQCEDGMHLVENEADVDALEVRAPDNLGYVTQTTLSVDDTARLAARLAARFPKIRAPRKDDICYATQNRQDAVKKMAARCDVVLVVGSAASSNSNRLREVAVLAGTPAYLLDCAADIAPAWLAGAKVAGVTAGASAPEPLVREVVARLRENGASVEEMDGGEEKVVFVVPKSLAERAAAPLPPPLS
ncbi:MAG: 4-hydroxy-3-methylbut-2-enyl diphosphate reductase [Gammaproteobacteria bacterium]